MANFNIGDEVNYFLGRTECTGKLIEVFPNGTARVQHGDSMSDIEFVKLLRPKAPGFEVRGLVITMSATHGREAGEIIATGTGPKPIDGSAAKRFFKVHFASNDSEEWFGEDQVFVADDPAKKRRPGIVAL